MINLKDNSNWDLIITPKRGWFEINFNEIWHYRDLVRLFVKRDFTTFYKQTILGPIWFLLQPLITTIVFTVIFNKVAKIPTDGVPPYLFYMSAVIAWNYFAGCLSSTSSTFTSNASLFEKVYFPRIIIPISKVISGLIRFFVQLVMFLGFYIYYIIFEDYKISISYHAVYIIPFFILQMAMLGQGIGMIVSSITSKYRDLSHLVTFGTQLLMYASPIVFPLSVVPIQYKNIILLNPMTSIIEGFRKIFIGGGQIDFYMVLYSSIITLLFFTLGLLIFNKVEKTFIDTV
ncbi:MAG: ABC transporter permease [Candidatus Marinimicrobia bacterium]|nr:ABC transporter permease [Candidatus Neomarinimicrobiota bacterium]